MDPVPRCSINLVPYMTRATELLRPALEQTGGTHREVDLWEGVLLGWYQLWMGGKSAVITEVLRYPTSLAVLHVWLAGGDLSELRDEILPEIERWGREEGCQRVTIAGRKGWARALKDYSARWMYLTKEIAGE